MPNSTEDKNAARPATDASTPLMRQYHALKAKHPDAFLFFRLGDFYELFFDDAVKAAPLLEVVLTQRQNTPMCGVPHHAMASYLAKLLKRGHRVAVAEQMEDPATTKGMVRRDVVRTISPGTVVEDELLAEKQNNFLVAVAPRDKKTWGLAAADISTGEFFVLELAGDNPAKNLSDELARLSPREIIHPRGQSVPATALAQNPFDERAFEGGAAAARLVELFNVKTLAGFGIPAGHAGLPAAGALVRYLEQMNPTALGVLKPPRCQQLDDVLMLDETALRHLDLIDRPTSDAGPQTLLDVLDHTVTPMGGRRLKWWLLHPLKDPAAIQRRLGGVEYLVENGALRKSLAEKLRNTSDVERILTRLASGHATGRDMVALRKTLKQMPDLTALLSEKHSLNAHHQPLIDLIPNLQMPPELLQLLETSLCDDPPMRLSDGGVIRDGFSAELDELRGYARRGRQWISDLEARERERTGIASLKVGFTSVFGYYLEVRSAALSKVPPEWIRKQTLANAERFITPELKAQEDKILGADDKSRALEAALFSQIRAQVLEHKDSLRRAADALSDIDALASLAAAAERGRFKKPVVSQEGPIVLKAARHPVVERVLAQKNGAAYVPNDLLIDGADNQILIVTGPNMAGKSTYLRQAALIVIMAQMGSFVPAESAEIGVVDRIFTRIGAGDNLAAGASTFLVEMQEVANILNNATPRSLVILDEVGRGTSTYDGLAVAWAVVEHLLSSETRQGPKVMFATHYFELTSLADEKSGIKNYHATVREWTRPDGETDIVFLHQILPGPADRSYGVHVAQMAGLPADCIARARNILKSLEAQAENTATAVIQKSPEPAQLPLFATHPLIESIKRVDPNGLTPLEALNLLNRWHQILSSGRGQKIEEGE